VVALVLVVLLAAGSVAFGLGHWRHGEYTFIASIGGHPYRWNPCAPVHYVVNLRNAPPGALHDVTVVASRVEAATGMNLVYDGPTDEPPSRSREPYEPDRYGHRWAPVLIAWVSPVPGDGSQWTSTGPQFAGLSTPQVPRGGFGGDVYVSGWIVINTDSVSGPGFAAPDEEGPVLQHEFGHVVGLGHTTEWGELMNPVGGGMTDWGPGDLEGLAKLGRQDGCLRTPPVP